MLILGSKIENSTEFCHQSQARCSQLPALSTSPLYSIINYAKWPVNKILHISLVSKGLFLSF